MFKQALIVSFAVLALASGAALAHPSAGSAAAPAAAPGGSWHDHAAGLAKLKVDLKITPPQEGAWENFTQAMTAMHPQRPMSRPPAAATSAPLPAPQVFATMAQHAQDFAARAQELSSAASGLYQVLTPAQQATLDAHLAKMHERMMHHRHHHGQPMKSAAPASG